jgi:hypothetical protein
MTKNRPYIFPKFYTEITFVRICVICKFINGVKGKARLAHVMKVYREIDVYLHSFLTSALDRPQCSYSRRGRFRPKERFLGTQLHALSFLQKIQSQLYALSILQKIQSQLYALSILQKNSITAICVAILQKNSITAVCVVYSPQHSIRLYPKETDSNGTGFFSRKRHRALKTSHPSPVPGLRISGSIPPLHHTLQWPA